MNEISKVWRPLKDAPTKDGEIVAVRRVYRSDGGPTVPHAVATCRGCVWVWNDGDRINISNWEYAPIADTYELDGAVQYAVAIAFGQLVALLADGMNCGECCGGGCRTSQQALAIEDFGRIVRTAMGGRIPDEVP